MIIANLLGSILADRPVRNSPTEIQLVANFVEAPCLILPALRLFLLLRELTACRPMGVPRVSRVPRVAVLPAVACGVSLCCIVVGDNLWSGRDQKSEQVISLQKNSVHKTHSAFTGAVPEGYCRGTCSTIGAPSFSIEMS